MRKQPLGIVMCTEPMKICIARARIFFASVHAVDKSSCKSGKKTLAAPSARKPKNGEEMADEKVEEPSSPSEPPVAEAAWAALSSAQARAKSVLAVL